MIEKLMSIESFRRNNILCPPNQSERYLDSAVLLSNNKFHAMSKVDCARYSNFIMLYISPASSYDDG